MSEEPSFDLWGGHGLFHQQPSQDGIDNRFALESSLLFHRAEGIPLKDRRIEPVVKGYKANGNG